MEVLTTHEPGSDTPVYLHPVGDDRAILLSPVDSYRESVFQGTCHVSICEEAQRTTSEWEADRATYRRRQDAAQGLERLTKQEAAAAAAERSASNPLPALTDDLTVGQLRTMIRGIAPRQDTESYEGFARGICMLPGEPLRRRAAASNALTAVRFLRQDAENLLLQTAAKPPANPTADGLKSAIRDVELRIAGRQPAIDADKYVPLLRERVAGIQRGTISITQVGEWSRVWAGQPTLPARSTAKTSVCCRRQRRSLRGC